jgi:shikimate dehydrogenase
MTDRYALFGNPLRQSKSPIIHGALALATAQDPGYKVTAPLTGAGSAAAAVR